MRAARRDGCPLNRDFPNSCTGSIRARPTGARPLFPIQAASSASQFCASAATLSFYLLDTANDSAYSILSYTFEPTASSW